MNDRDTVKASVTRSYKALRERTDPRAHDLLDALEISHLEAVDHMFDVQALATGMVAAKVRAGGLQLIEEGAE